MSAPPKNSAFGEGSPSWNLPFPSGNLTAAEIIAYLPHWLKSIDVIDRFVTNGAKAWAVAAMVNEFRHLPVSRTGDPAFRANSATVMMSFAMRKAGYKNWTLGTHDKFERPNPNLVESDLNVQSFRTPRITHPKNVPSGKREDVMKRNQEPTAINFKDLALHVKKHPSGDDALDLARCVRYCITHPKENWYFPRDFEALVNKLGGPATVFHSHLDNQVFNRRANFVFPAAVKAPPLRKRKRILPGDNTSSSKVVPQSRKCNIQSANTSSSAPLKHKMNTEGTIQLGSRRKSGRLATKTSVNLRECESDNTDNDVFEFTHSVASASAAKRRKISRVPPTPGTPSNDSDFVQGDSEPDDEVPEAETVSEEELIQPKQTHHGRAAARRARHAIHSMSTETQRNINALSRAREREIDLSNAIETPEMIYQHLVPVSNITAKINPEMLFLARSISSRQPVFLNPPQISDNRLRVDSSSIFLYAAEGCATIEEMWDSALSSTRFNGPRRHAPFRELHRLSDPPSNDDSDWAENIRWAKQQHRLYGSETWTEYDYHLDLIAQHRRAEFWVSEELISGGH